MRATSWSAMVANFQPVGQGVARFLDAAPEILRAVPSARFLLLGKGEGRSGRCGKRRGPGVGPFVIFAGYRQDIDRYYAIMDVFGAYFIFRGIVDHASWNRCGCGVPVVATRVGGKPGGSRDGVTGITSFRPETLRRFASRTIELLLDRDLRKRMGRQGRRSVERHFQLRMSQNRYQEVYEGLLSGVLID